MCRSLWQKARDNFKTDILELNQITCHPVSIIAWLLLVEIRLLRKSDSENICTKKLVNCCMNDGDCVNTRWLKVFLVRMEYHRQCPMFCNQVQELTCQGSYLSLSKSKQ